MNNSNGNKKMKKSQRIAQEKARRAGQGRKADKGNTAFGLTYNEAFKFLLASIGIRCESFVDGSGLLFVGDKDTVERVHLHSKVFAKMNGVSLAGWLGGAEHKETGVVSPAVKVAFSKNVNDLAGAMSRDLPTIIEFI